MRAYKLRLVLARILANNLSATYSKTGATKDYFRYLTENRSKMQETYLSNLRGWSFDWDLGLVQMRKIKKRIIA